MKKFSIIVLLGVVLTFVLSACGTTPYTGDPTTSAINVTGNAKVNMVPDIAYINIGVHSESEDVTEALQQNTSQGQAISGTLGEMGVAVEDIQTTAFNVFPIQEYGPMGEVMQTKYVVENSVLVTVRDLSNLGDLLDAVVQAGANNINSISFDAQDKEAAYSEARRLAVENARMQAEELAAAAGVEVGDVKSISVYSSGPIPAYEVKAYQGQGGSTVPIAAGEIVISVDASMSFAIK